MCAGWQGAAGGATNNRGKLSVCVGGKRCRVSVERPLLVRFWVQTAKIKVALSACNKLSARKKSYSIYNIYIVKAG